MGIKARESTEAIEATEPIGLDYETCRALLAAAAGDESRPALQYIHITSEYAEATNGHVLIRVPHRTGKRDDEVDLLLHRTALKNVKRSPKDQWLYIAPESRRVWVGKGPAGYEILADLTAAGHLIGSGDDEYNYPKTQQVIDRAAMPAENEIRRLGLGAPVLHALTEIAKLDQNYRGQRLVLELPAHGAGFNNRPADHVTSAVRIKVLRDGGEDCIGLAMPMLIS